MQENRNFKSYWNNFKSNRRTHAKVLLALVIGVLIGIPIGAFVKDSLASIATIAWNAGDEDKDYDIQEIEVDYLQMLDGGEGEVFEIVNGVKCFYECKEAYPFGDRIVYKFHGYIGAETSKMVQKLQFDYIVKPSIANGKMIFSGGEIAKVLLEPDSLVVGIDGMKRIINAFVVPQLKAFGLDVPTGAFGIQELYSKLVVIKVSKEK